MNKLSKLTALLLALVLALGVPLQVMAESADTTVQDAIDTLTDYLKVADKALYTTIMGFTKYSDYWEIGYLLEDEDVIAYIANNDADRVKAIQDHLDKLWWDGCVSYGGVAGPLMPPVETGTATYALRSMARDVNPGNGLELTKTAVDNEDGTYTITLEAYAQGSVTQEVTGVPVDIVLVLDYSSSMTETFGTQQRIAALRTAVAGFIDTIKNKYNDETANHRISIVLFDGDIHAQLGWRHVTGDYVDEMKNFVKNTATGSGTNPAAGLNRAIALFGDEYNPPNPTTRQKAVVLFTDGLPANPVDTNTINAITAANQLKSQDVTIYTVAVHSSANPSATPSTQPSTSYGSTTLLNALLHATSSNYPTASASNSESTFVPCPHWNYGGWCYQGCEQYDEGLGYYETQFTITYGDRKTVDGQVVDYYFSANNPDDLNSKFENIAQQVQSGGAAIQLGTSTVVIDTVSQYFQLPEGATTEDIKVYTQNYLGDEKWGARVEFDADKKIEGRKVSVSNFDYTKNFVAETGRDEELGAEVSGTFRGRKLVIEFDVVAIPGFIGGNDVVTNDTSSGVYQPDENNEPKPVETFPVPDVNVAFKQIYIQKEEQYIYLSNYANLDTLLTSFGITYTFAVGDDSVYEVNGYNNGYVMLRYRLTDPVTGNELYYTIMPGQDEGTWSYVSKTGEVTDSKGFDIRPYLKDDHTYNISYEVFAKEKVNEDGTVNEGITPETTGTLQATVYVFKPEVTFQDSKYKYMAQITDATIAADHYNQVNWLGDTRVLWKNSNFTWDLDQRPNGIVPTGPRPTLTFEYTPAISTWLNSSNKVATTVCVPVNVTKVTATSTYEATSTSAGGSYAMDVTGRTTSYREELDCALCAYEAAADKKTKIATLTKNDEDGTETITVDSGTPEFVIHVYDVTGHLQITKEVVNDTGFTPTQTEFQITVELTGSDLKDSYVVKQGDTTVSTSWTPGTNSLTGTFTVTATKDASAVVLIEDILNGTGYTVSEVVPVGFTGEITNPVTHETAGVIDGSKTDEVLVKNTYKVGTLNVTKNVEGIMTSDYPSTFGFTLEIKDVAGQVITPNVKIGDTLVENGSYTFTLTDGQSIAITGIPQGATYTVTENVQVEGKNVADYFDVSATGEKVNSNTVSGAIAAGVTDSAEFKNTAKTGSLKISKTISGNGADGNDNFLFSVTGPKDYSTFVVLKGGQSVTLTNLPFGDYVVTEDTDWSWRYTLDGENGKPCDVVPGSVPTAEFTNNRSENKWLSDEYAVHNDFSKNGTYGSQN